MKMNFIVQLLIVLCSMLCYFDVKADEVRCEEIKVHDWSYTGERLTCYVNSSYISWNGVTIAKADVTVGALWLEGNKRVSSLPVEVSKTFPHLFGYNAESCSVSLLFKANFLNLGELEFLSLENNKIEMINRDTFEDLVSLKVLYLGHNKIKTMSGAVFRRLTKAHYINLSRNECINEGFTSSRDIIERMFEIVNANCGFYDSEDVFNLSEYVKVSAAEDFKKLHAAQSIQNDELKLFLETTIKEKENLLLKIAELQIKIYQLETQLGAEVEARERSQSQTLLIKEGFAKLEAQLNSTCYRRSHDSD